MSRRHLEARADGTELHVTNLSADGRTWVRLASPGDRAVVRAAAEPATVRLGWEPEARSLEGVVAEELLTPAELEERVRQMAAEEGLAECLEPCEPESSALEIPIGPRRALRLRPDVTVGATEEAFFRRMAIFAIRSTASPVPDLVTRSIVLNNAIRFAELCAKRRSAILLQGETGVGKEAFARLVHRHSRVNEGPFIAISPADIPESAVPEAVLFGNEKIGTDVPARTGILQAAHGGTLFLDEVHTLTPGLRSALLRVLETKRARRVGSKVDYACDFRLVAATNLELALLEEAIGRDLLWRISTLTVRIPALRERGAPDIEALFEHFGATFECPDLWQRIDPAGHRLLESQQWPGNVRQLAAIAERLTVELDRARVEVLGVDLVQGALQGWLQAPPSRRGEQEDDPALEQTLVRLATEFAETYAAHARPSGALDETLQRLKQLCVERSVEHVRAELATEKFAPVARYLGATAPVIRKFMGRTERP